MEIKLDIPEYLSIKDWKYFNSLEYLSETEKMITLIAHLTNKELDEVRKWKPTTLTSVYKTLLEAFQDLEPQFYPVFELDGVLYGFNSMTKLTLGEYVDLERLAVKSHENLEEIMAILYRPITKHRFKGLKWAFKNSTKVAMGDAENLFKYYDTEEYDSSVRYENAEKLSNIPASIALGAISFFLLLGSSVSINSNLSSLPPQQQMKMMEAMNKQMDLLNIGAGLAQFIFYLRHPSYQSQDKKLSQNSISSSYLTSWHMNKISQIAKNRLENKKNELIK